MFVFTALFQILRSLLVPRLVLVTENLALRQQLLILHRAMKRPRLRNRDRLFWVALSHLWRDWRSILVIVKPETVIKWHRQGFKCYWRWKSRTGRVGRPRVDQEIRDLISRMSRENPLWGVPRIQAELHLLGYEVAESTVARYRVRSRKPPSQNWKSFLTNHVGQIVAIDFFTVPTVTFNILYGFVVLLHDRRLVVHFNVTAHPTAVWTASSRNLVGSMRDIVWAIGPEQNELVEVVMRVRQFASDVLEAKGIKWDFLLPAELERIKLSPEQRRHLFLTFKEAINNSARYAACHNMRLSLATTDHQLVGEIIDDGCGFEDSPLRMSATRGHGMANMQRRSTEIGGSLKISSTPGQGTRIRLTIPLGKR